MHQRLFCSAAVFCSCAAFSLIAAPLRVSSLPVTYDQTNTLSQEEEDLLFHIPDTILYENTLLGQEHVLADTDDALSPPFEEADSNIEEQTPSAADAKMQPDLQKVLYDPKLNYGTGSPIPKPTPVTTAKRNLIVLGSSLIMATVAMLVVSSNKGLDAPSSH